MGRGRKRGAEEKLEVIKEEFGGRKWAGCERRVVAENTAKETNTIKAHLSGFFLFSLVHVSEQSREEGGDKLGSCTHQKTKKKQRSL